MRSDGGKQRLNCVQLLLDGLLKVVESKIKSCTVLIMSTTVLG